MNLTRLMVLGTLSRYGAQHGHQIRRLAEVTDVGEWGGVSVGAMYRELRGMESEGLVAAVRTEKVGNRPARTVYEITAEGRLELMMLRENAIRQLAPGPDPLGVALHFAAHDMDRTELRQMLRVRRDRLAITGAELAAELERLTGKGGHDLLMTAIMRRGIQAIEAEVRWHDELDAELAAAPAAAPGCERPLPAAARRAALERAVGQKAGVEEAAGEKAGGLVPGEKAAGQQRVGRDASDNSR